MTTLEKKLAGQVRLNEIKEKTKHTHEKVSDDAINDIFTLNFKMIEKSQKQIDFFLVLSLIFLPFILGFFMLLLVLRGRASLKNQKESIISAARLFEKETEGKFDFEAKCKDLEKSYGNITIKIIGGLGLAALFGYMLLIAVKGYFTQSRISDVEAQRDLVITFNNASENEKETMLQKCVDGDFSAFNSYLEGYSESVRTNSSKQVKNKLCDDFFSRSISSFERDIKYINKGS